MYKYKQLAEIYEFIFGRLARQPAPNSFNKEDLQNIRIGRTLKKKSIKIKRTFFEILAIWYCLMGLFAIILRIYIRSLGRKVKRNLNTTDYLWTFFLWPRLLRNIAQRFYLQYSA